MKLVKTASGKKTIKMSKSDWEAIGKKAGWTTAEEAEIIEGSGEIYLLDKGVLYDEEGEEVFDMKKLIKYFEPMKEIGITKIPKFKNPEQANAFLARIEEITGDTLGRVEDENLLKTLRYKDTRKEKQEQRLREIDERDEKVIKNIHHQDPEEIAKRRKQLEELEEKERQEDALSQLILDKYDASKPKKKK